MSTNFNLLGNSVAYPDGFDRYAVRLGAFVQKADEAARYFDGLYKGSKNLNEVLYTMQGQAPGAVTDAAALACQILSEASIEKRPDEFIAKYGERLGIYYEPHIMMTLSARDQIMGACADRLRMRGAPAMGPQGPVVDGEARNQLNQLYKDPRTKDILVAGIRTAILNVFRALLEELSEAGKYSPAVRIDPAYAAELFHMGQGGFGQDPNAMINMVSAITVFPGEKSYYDALFNNFLSTEGSDFERFLAFWGVDWFYPGIAEKRRSAKQFDVTFRTSDLVNFDFNNYSAENYIYLRQSLYALNMGDPRQYPEYSAYAAAIRTYCYNISCMDRFFADPMFVRWLPEGVPLEEFVRYVRMERDALPISPYLSFWILGDPVGEKVPYCPKQNILDSTTYENDLIIMNCPQGMMGQRGITVTRNFVTDIRKSVRIPLANVTDIIYDGADTIRITDGMNYIDMGQLPTPFINPKQFPVPQQREALKRALTLAFLNLLRLYCIRYGGNQFLRPV